MRAATSSSAPGVLLLVSFPAADGDLSDGLLAALGRLSAGAKSFRVSRRSGFTSVKRDEHGNDVPLVPLIADVLVEAAWASADERGLAVAATADELRYVRGLTFRFVSGDVHDVISGRGEVTVAFFAAGRSHLTRHQFHDYWLNNHALIALQVPNGPSYRQLHVRESATGVDSLNPSEVDQTTWFGVTTMQYPSYDVLAKTRVSPTVAVTAFLDEQKFIDHSRSSMAFFDAVNIAS